MRKRKILPIHILGSSYDTYFQFRVKGASSIHEEVQQKDVGEAEEDNENKTCNNNNIITWRKISVLCSREIYGESSEKQKVRFKRKLPGA